MNKKYQLTHAKAIDPETKTITAYVSTYEWDRTEEKFAKGAWDLSKYRQNPVVLYGHDYTSLPIAKAIRIEEDDNGLWAEMKFAPDQRSQDIFELYKGGFLSAFSVGFNPKEYKLEPIDAERKGIVYTNAELLEFSAVPIPANPGALIGRDMAELAIKSLGEKAIVKMKVGEEDKFTVAPYEGPEEPEGGEPEPTPEPPPAAALESSLKSVIEIAKTARKEKLGKPHLSLLKTAMDVFQDVINEHQEGVPAEAVSKLAEVVGQYAKVVENLLPDASLTVRRVMTHIEKAIAAPRA